MCVATHGNKVKEELADQGFTCLWLGYAEGCPEMTYQVYNLETGNTRFTRDLVFLRTDMKQPIKEKEGNLEGTPSKDSMLAHIIDDDDDIVPNLVRQVSESDSEDESDDEDDDSAKNDGYTTPTTRIAGSGNYDTADKVVEDSSSDSGMDDEAPVLETAVNMKLVQAMQNLESSYNPEANRIVAIGRDSMVDEKANYLIDVAKIAKYKESTENK